MSRTMMTNERIFELIEAYGAEPGAWPEDEREAAEAELAANPAVYERALADARALDLAFANETIPDLPHGLAERILAAAPREARGSQGLLSRLGRLIAPNGLRWPAGAALASLMMGLMAGYATAPAMAETEYQAEADEVVYAAFGYDGFETYLSETDG